MKFWSCFLRKMKRRQTPIYSALIDVDTLDPTMRDRALSSLPENRPDDIIPPDERGGMANLTDSHDFQSPTFEAPPATEFRASEVDESLPWLPSAATEIRLPSTSYHFGEVGVGKYEFWILSLHNQGENEAIISDVSGLPENGFSVLELALPFTIPPHETRVITVRYAPDQAGTEAAASLSITTNDPNVPIQTVLLTGIGVAPPRNETGCNLDKCVA
jgi:Abnormal spindle-like microcephaly-assoc'd, ASPM-SPD-2-Hydin